MEEGIIKELNETFRRGVTRSIETRKTQLRALSRLLEEMEDDCFDALNHDLRKSSGEAYRDEIGPLKKSIDYALAHLKDWMSPKKAGIRLIFFPAKGKTMPEPYGVVLVISTWNLPIKLALEPMIGALAAGNTVVLKPSELAPECSSFLAKYIGLYLDSKAIKVVEGDAIVSQRVLQHNWDKIFYTGSGRVGRIILSEAAKHLTPVSLELGGKCPCIFDFQSLSSNMEVAVKRVALICWRRQSRKFTGGSVDEENLIVEPTILLNPELDAEVMTDEIFGPIPPIITLRTIDESIGFINSRPKPLAVYAFTNNEMLKERVLKETSSGAAVFNDFFLHFICDELPFGGIGASGMGRYHGKYSFDAVSHCKAVLDTGFLVELKARYPPWNGFKMAFIRTAYKFDYCGLLLLLLGLGRYTTKLHRD